MKIEKRKKIQDAAVSVFLEKGFHQSKIEDIIQVAEIGKGTFYLYFKNKEELALSLYEEFLESFNEIHNWVRESISLDNSAADIFKKEGDQIIEVLLKNKQRIFFLLKEGRSVSEQLGHLMDEFYDNQIHTANITYTKAQKLGLLKPELDPHYAAIFVVGAISQLYTMWLEEKIDDPPQVILEKTLGFFIGALLDK